MNIRICTILFLILAFAGIASLSHAQQTPPPPAGLFQGTPEEQAACSSDATRLCSEAIPDTLRVLACLKVHREKLRKACQKVLEDHGQ